MTKKIAVTYKSNYGTTKKYAEWLAKELQADLFEQKVFPVHQITDYDLIIHGGGLYAGGILGSKFLQKHPERHYILFTVGLADPQTTDYTKILDRNLPTDLRHKTKVFHFRGGIDYQKLSRVHLTMMKMMKKLNFDHKRYEDLSSEDQQFIDTYGKKVDFTNHQAIELLVTYIRTLA